MKTLALFIFASTLVGYWCSPLSCPAKTWNRTQTIRSESNQDPNQADEKVYVGNDVDHKAVILSKPEPTYTAEAIRKNVVGVVSLRAVFTAKGDVRVVEALQRLPAGLTERA